jgi:predicted MFS family arabinose efflux permease
MYEAALGLGIAAGPLLGGLLGDISWRGPFFGVSALMAIALVATLFLLPATPKPDHRTSLSAPLRALSHRGLLTMSITALLYNWGFFTMLGYAPFPMQLSELQLGFVFFGWGLLVAFFSVIAAPRLQARYGTTRALSVALLLFAVDLLVVAVFTDIRWVLITAVVVAGAFIGVNNTLATQAVMLVSPVERPVASAAYGFVRFLGGGIAPYIAGRLAETFDVHVPFFVGTVAVVVAVAVLASGRQMLAAADAEMAREADVAGEVADEFGGAPDAIDEELRAERTALRS